MTIAWLKFSSFILFILLMLIGSVRAADRLQFLSEQNAPYNFIKDQQPQGLAVDILDEVLRRMNYPFKREDIAFLTWSRAYREAQQKGKKALYSPSPKRRNEKSSFNGRGRSLMEEV